ncbi:MAG TPA: IPT/TIG domain-containing protein [Solirubrobacteraceae bacterium]|nr:IPT/TIG domain-containing protein [Solirubrobacteraceae bacterium]
MRLVTVALTEADLKANARRQAAEAAAGSPAVANKNPIAGGLTPELLHAAYALPNATFPSSQQTIAVVDAFNDPTAEADLGVYDRQFGLPECTTANGCFRKLNQEGRASPLPQREGGWATEISLDVQMAHAICQGCHVMLVEANNESFANLGAAVDAAVSAGATEVSNSYGGAELSGYTADNGPYNHPGVVITASAGDCGYFNEGCRGAEAANFPASSPDVVAVGGTTLTESGPTWTSTVWEGGGSGCSVVFSAPAWQSAVAGFSATACDSGRSVADVAAVGNPYTGVEVYDSTANPGGYPTGWGVWGGTSVASPVIAAEFALGGGAHGVAYPAATLYSHIGEGSALYDVVSGSNGSCTDASSCSARHGYDGPTGVGSPIGLSAFATAVSPADVSPPSISGTAEQGQTLSLTRGDWTGSPSTYSERWLLCNASGSGCSPITGASGSTYALPASAVGSTIRVQETASNGSGSGSPVVSSATAAVISDAPVITSFTPSTGLTGSSVTIAGTAFTGATAVRIGGVKATFTVHSSTQVEATVPNGALAGTISLTTPVATGTSAGVFTPSLSLHSFSPAKAAPGATVTITGLGFERGSTVSFGGVKATSVTYVSSVKLKVLVPSGAASGAITVTNPTAPSGTVSSATSFTAT